MSDSNLFPVFLKLAGKRVLVVGGGPVATSKLDGLRTAGAEITVVAPTVSAEIRASGATIHERPFEERDLDDVWYVVAAATPEVNAAVSRAAAAQRLFVNAVDDPPNATAYLGGVVRRGSAAVAISTGGRAPALAGLLREAIDDVLPADLDRWFDQADEMKQRWRTTGVPMEARRPELAEAIARRYCGTLPSCRGLKSEGE